MTTDNLIDSIKENLNGRPGQPIVLGVCKTLAERFNQEPWVFRAAAIVAGLFWTVAALVIYVLLGFFMKETEDRTKGVFRGLFLWLNECCEKVIDGVRGIFGETSGTRGA